MQTKSLSRRQVTLSLGFALLCIVLTIITYVSIGGTIPFAPQGYRVKLPLPNAGNVVQGSDVDIAGVKVGSVVSVDRSGNRAIADIQIAPGFAPIRSGATAITRMKTLLGEAYIELAPGPQSAPPVADGGELAAANVRPAVTLDQFLQTFAPDTRARMRQMFAGLSTALAGRGQALNDSLGNASYVSGNLSGVLGTLSGETPQLQALFNDSGVVLAALGRRSGDLRAAIAAGNDAFAATASRNQQLSAIVHDLPPFLGQLRATSQTITDASGDLNRAVVALGPTAPLLATAVGDFNTDLPQIRALFAALPVTIAAGKVGLPPLTRILRAIPVAFDQLYPAARQLIPVMQLFATYAEPALILPLANEAAVGNGTSVGPDGKIVARPNLGFYWSNESVAGWVKRLPTNRANPYPTPDGLSQIGKIGFLKSYDCRNVHNTEYLPPTGTGVPPCVTQGPWEYQGKTAYYPRLQEAGP
jgi:ABC-type transporter Mla subunit MlaD